ncbi:MAG TPA: hypothetical protein VJB11_01955 [archaeon]|nr:hypothetical protein [archaeon]
MVGNLEEKARNYYILAVIAETFGMTSEAATNYFKALFAIDDAAITRIGKAPKDHTERFEVLKASFPNLYRITDRLFSTYRRTYTKDLEKGEVALVKKQVEEAFKYAKIELPKNEEIRGRIEEIAKKGKFSG